MVFSLMYISRRADQRDNTRPEGRFIHIVKSKIKVVCVRVRVGIKYTIPLEVSKIYMLMRDGISFLTDPKSHLYLINFAQSNQNQSASYMY